jgi:DNA-binding protein HU-beta
VKPWFERLSKFARCSARGSGPNPRQWPVRPERRPRKRITPLKGLKDVVAGTVKPPKLVAAKAVPAKKAAVKKATPAKKAAPAKKAVAKKAPAKKAPAKKA